MSEFTDYKVADMSLADWGRKEIPKTTPLLQSLLQAFLSTHGKVKP
jgi:adenosylhomocysteinase